MNENEESIYHVKQGDCIASIATERGFWQDTIWNYPANRSLKDLRKDPQVLHPGDEVVIPPKEFKEVTVATEKLHTFVCKGNLSKLRLRILENNKPRSNEKYILQIDGNSTKGKTKADGSLYELISPTAKKGKLILSPGEINERIYDLQLGSLDPKEEVSGVQGRLQNLGFPTEITGVMDDVTTQALKDFQTKYELPITGEIDNSTINKLAELYGC